MATISYPNYGLLSGLAEGLKQGLLTYQTTKNIQTQRQMEGAMHGLEQDENGDWKPNAAKQAQMQLEQAQTERSQHGLLPDSSESASARGFARGSIQQSNPGMSPDQLNSMVPDTMSAQDVKDYGSTFAKPTISGGYLVQGKGVAADASKEVAKIGADKATNVANIGAKKGVDVANIGAQKGEDVANINAQARRYGADQGLIGKKMQVEATKNNLDARQDTQAQRMANNDPVLKMYVPRLDGATKILDLIHSAQAHPDDIKSTQALLGQLNAEIARLETGAQSPGLGQAEKTEMNDSAAKWHNVLDTLSGNVTGVDLSQKYKQADAMVNELASSIKKNVDDRMKFLKAGGSASQSTVFDKKANALNESYGTRFTPPGSAPKPKTVIQNGHTYILNPATGNYE